MLRIYIGFQAIKFHCFLPPHFYCFSSTTTTTTFLLFSPTTNTAAATFLLFSLHHHHISIVSLHHHYHLRHHITIVFYPSPTRFIFFSSTRFYKRLPAAFISSFCSNVSCSKQQSWFSSAVSLLPCSSAPVAFKESHSTITTFTSLSLVQFTYGTHFHPRRK